MPVRARIANLEGRARSKGGSPTGCRDPDLNQHGAADQTNIDALINVVVGAQCP